jgi:aspartate/methionine/tyrosine aminotransferase
MIPWIARLSQLRHQPDIGWPGQYLHFGVPATMNQRGVSHKARQFTESVIRDMTRLCIRHNGVNLAQGFPDFPAPAPLKEAAKAAIDADINQYAITWGSASFRRAISSKVERFLGLRYDPETEITVTCGSTEAMIASMLAVVDPGQEVVVFEPFYENYGPDAILCGAKPRYVPLNPPNWSFDRAQVEAVFNQNTRALILNSPHNPTGKVFSKEELEFLAGLCQRWDVLVITDEIYEHILYDGAEHLCMATLPGMRERTIVINGLSKTYSVTGWRVGYVLACQQLTSAVRKVHDFLTVGAAAPLQEAGVLAMGFPGSYYQELASQYRARRDMLMEGLVGAGFRTFNPHGAYYIMTDISGFGFPDDVTFCRFLVEEIGVAAVPGSSFYSEPQRGSQQVRFCFCKREETLAEAARRLSRLQSGL